MNRYKIRYSYDKVKEIFENEGYTLLSKEYRNNYTKLKYLCPKNHSGAVTFHNWQRGCRCKECYLVYKKRNKFSDIKKMFEDEGYILLSKKYKSNRQKLYYICPKGHKGNIVYYSWQQGSRCRKCSFEKKAVNRRLDIADVIKYIEDVGYKYLSGKYINSRSKLKVRCLLDHEYKVNWSDFNQGRRCPICAVIDATGPNSPVWNHEYSKQDRFDFETYRAYVKQLTNYNYKKYYYLINPSNLKREFYGFHVDHIYSVENGFRNKLNAKVISSPVNLRMLWHSDNYRKKNNSEIILNQLYDLYNQFEQEIKIL